MRVFLVCKLDGSVLEVLTSEDFETAYDKTVARNHGELLVEVGKEVLEKIVAIVSIGHARPASSAL